MLGVGDAELGVGPTARVRSAPGGSRQTGHRRVEQRRQLPPFAVTDLEDQFVAVGEVEVDRRGGHPDGGGDGPDGQRLGVPLLTSNSSAAARMSSRRRPPSPRRARDGAPRSPRPGLGHRDLGHAAGVNSSEAVIGTGW